MAQLILNDESAETLHHVAADIDAALRYLPADGGIDREHAERWRDELKRVLAGRVQHRHGGGRKRPVEPMPGQ